MPFIRDWQEFLVQFLVHIYNFNPGIQINMQKSKLLFVILAIVFIVILVIVAIDITSRTNFPGQNKSPSEKIESDSTPSNSQVPN